MRYIELTLNTPENVIDDCCAVMTELGAGGFVIENESDFKEFLENNHQYWDYVDEELERSFKGVSRIKTYLTDDDEGKKILERIRDSYPKLTTAYIEDSDWENNWRKFYQPIEVGERLVIVPEWLDVPDDGRLALRLDPGLIFGTGSHATTRMCLTALEDCVHPGARLLDLGCGSGILGIGGIVLGAQSSVGCDIDPKAPDVAASNAALNGIGADRFTVYAGDLIADASIRRRLGGDYDIVLANIVSDVIIPLSAHVRAFMKPDAVFITSGIIEGRQDEVKAAMEANGLSITSHRCEEEWHCYTAVLT